MSAPRLGWPLLLVEDDEATARCLARLLEPYGPTHTVGLVRDGLCALRLQRYAGVLVDIGLPDGCGFGLAKEIRLTSPNLPMMVLTGSTRPEDINRAAALGLRLACKPCGIDELLPLVDDAQRGSSRRSAAETAVRCAVERWNLTRRETEILQAAVKGVTPLEYRRAAGISENTYKGYVRLLLAKSDALSLTALALDLIREVAE